MKCKKCGASLLDTDKFCDQCGWKVVKERRCPECGAALREGTKFCPTCGVLIGSGKSDEEKVFVRDEETSDIPIGDIEQNILSETERELHTGKKKRPAAAAPKKSASASAPKKSVPAPEPKKKKKPEPVKKKVYEEWDDEDEDDEDDDDDTGSNFMVIMTAAMAFLIVVLAVPLFFIVKGNFPVKNYGASAEAEQDNEVDDAEAENDGEAEPEPEEDNAVEIEEPDSEQPVGTLSIVGSDKVNVRDNPSTKGTNVITQVKAGELYEYMGTTDDGEWYIILLEDGSTGYVFGQYVSVD